MHEPLERIKTPCGAQSPKGQGGMVGDKVIVTLLAEAGRQWDEKKEAIGTHGRSIVFLPRGVNPGEKVRVELEEVRADARGRMMYRGRPAPVQSVERWVERDGKIERIELSVNWKLQETELRVLESRPIVRRDGEAHKSSTFVVDWGMSLQTARVTVTTKTEIPELEERIEVSYAAPYQKTMARRDGGTVTETFAVEGIEPIRSGYCEANDWRYNRLRAEYVGEPELYVRFKLAYDGDKSMETPSAIKWPDLPVWVQDYLSALNPVCGCGRERVDAASTQTVCSFCRREAQFEQSFPIARREALAAQAAKLAVVEPVPQETGEIILRSVFDHVAHSWSTNRDLLAEKSAGYAWYYFVGDGVYGSKFPPAALQVLAHLALASGAALQELAGWIAGPHKPNPHALREYEQSYYIKTQVRGEAAEYEPSVSTGELETMVVAVRLCGSMADRSAALDGFERAKASLGASDAMILEIDRILQGADQDFGLALSKLREIETVLAAQERGEILVNFGGYFRRMGATGNADSWVISPDGSRREPDQKEGRRRYEESEGSKYWHIVGTDELAISWSKANTAASHEFVVNKRPVRGLTAQQLATVEAIEEEILGSYYGMSMSGETMSPSLGRGWGFGSGTVEGRMAEREKAMKAALSRSRILRVSEHIDMRQASMREGTWVNELDVQRGRLPAIPHRDSDVEFDRGRERAWVVETLPAGEGTIEVLAVERQRNDRPEVRYRWVRGSSNRTIVSEPDTTPALQERRETPAEPAKKSEPVDLSKVDLSKLFGGGAKKRR